MRITSPAFRDHEPIPAQYTCDGANINPPLEFHELPPETKTLVLMVEDTDAPANPWVHWLVFNIPATTTRVAENAIPEGAVEGLANGGTHGYEGPCPRYFAGTHHYKFRLYALDTGFRIPASTDRSALLPRMEGHILAEAILVGTAEGAAERV